MKRVAVITDIHANLLALETSLERIDGLEVGAAYCGGDLVGYGPHPNEVSHLIDERRIPTIYGNYDYAIARRDRSAQQGGWTDCCPDLPTSSKESDRVRRSAPAPTPSSASTTMLP